ncbi:MAG: hypothetical protein GTN93_28095 [Anaerolineae bacterium]|nr:hypothetical protein [Anaerolineae bacterium]
MGESLQLALLVIVIVMLYLISSRWQPQERTLLNLRTLFWIGLAALFVAVIMIALSRAQQP